MYAVRDAPLRGNVAVACKVVNESQARRAPHDVGVEVAVLSEIRHEHVSGCVSGSAPRA